MSDAKKVAEAYVEHINAKNLEGLLALFSDDGELVHPFGVFSGKEKLEEFYGGIVMHADTVLSVSAMVAEGNSAVAEVAGVSPQAPDQAQYALDLFELNGEGKISSLRIYYRNTL